VTDGVRTALRGVGQTLITAGVVVLLFCAWSLWFTGLVTDREQGRLDDELRRTWAAQTAPVAAAAPEAAATPGAPETPAGAEGPADRAVADRGVAADPGGPAAPAGAPAPTAAAVRPVPGQALAVLRIPRLADDHAVVVVEGTGPQDLRKGPGHMAGTAQPGEVGNVVVSGHRTTYGSPFADLDRLEPGDAIVVETRDTWFTYRVTGSRVVRQTETGGARPVPGRPGAEPSQRLLTLTTCHPRYSAQQRLIVHAELEHRLAKTAGDPPALAASASRAGG
jgi:sortase A